MVAIIQYVETGDENEINWSDMPYFTTIVYNTFISNFIIA